MLVKLGYRSRTFGPYGSKTEPSNIDMAWKFLGFDVSDDDQLSGLSNCGLNESECSRQERENWGKLLNEFHLFSSYEDADRFRIWIDKRVEEHVPFSVYGLYIIKEIIA